MKFLCENIKEQGINSVKKCPKIISDKSSNFQLTLYDNVLLQNQTLSFLQRYFKKCIITFFRIFLLNLLFAILHVSSGTQNIVYACNKIAYASDMQVEKICCDLCTRVSTVRKPDFYHFWFNYVFIPRSEIFLYRCSISPMA